MRHVATYIAIASLTLAIVSCGDSNNNSKSHTANIEANEKGAEQETLSPSFDCSAVSNARIESMICQQPELAQLDNQLNKVYQQALNKAGSISTELKATQRGWLKGRNDCWKNNNKRQCIKKSYQRRTAELQARYRLVDSVGQLRLICNNNPQNEFIVTFFNTDPRTLIAERVDQTSLMYNVVSASGAKYQGQNEIFWEHQGEVRITWGYQAPELTCQKSSFTH